MDKPFKVCNWKYDIGTLNSQNQKVYIQTNRKHMHTHVDKQAHTNIITTNNNMRETTNLLL